MNQKQLDSLLSLEFPTKEENIESFLHICMDEAEKEDRRLTATILVYKKWKKAVETENENLLGLNVNTCCGCTGEDYFYYWNCSNSINNLDEPVTDEDCPFGRCPVELFCLSLLKADDPVDLLARIDPEDVDLNLALSEVVREAAVIGINLKGEESCK